MKVAFLDRDGTIISDYPDNEWAEKEIPEFLPHSIEALRLLNSMGFKIIMVTNQYVINDHIITEKQFENFHHILLTVLENNGVEILDTFYCPHNDKDNCNCKKPKPGLINMALSKYPNIDIHESILVGDSMCDIELARKFNLPAYGIEINRQSVSYSKFIRVSSLYEAVTRILDAERK